MDRDPKDTIPDGRPPSCSDVYGERDGVIDWRSLDQEFNQCRSSRLAMGEHEYGDRGFRRCAPEGLAEAEEEIIDLANYCLMVWTRIRTLRNRLRELEARHG